MTGPFPVPNPTVPYWRTELHALDSHRSTPELPQEQDIVIIGAGFAGAALAHYLLKDEDGDDGDSETPRAPRPRPRPSVTILEAREACSGASSRHGGQLRPDLFVGVARRMQARGLATAHEVAAFEVANARAVAALVADERVDCDLRAVTAGDVFVDAGEAARAAQLWDALSRLRSDGSGGGGAPLLPDVVAHLDPAAAEAASGVRGARAAFTYPAATLAPYKLAMHLLAAAVARGANLQTRTPVDAVDGPDARGRWTLSTARGPTRARHVLFATGAYLAGLLPEYADAVCAARGAACRVVVSPPASPPPLALGACTLDAPCAGAAAAAAAGDAAYAVRAPDGSLVLGGGAGRAFAAPPALWHRNYDDATLMAPATRHFGGWAARTLLGWEAVPARVDSEWTGVVGCSADGAPHVGPVPGRPGLHVCAGFDGGGLPNALLCARGLARIVRDGAPFADAGVPACYETTAERLRQISEAEAAAEAATAGRARADVYLKF
ncbi:FAD dependent oxidoreductase [Durotheca rogersii]|uniref:FAD dependent oxidoreductase n=1 Tax=Durotheca rogersii TaxID=419775 RepID=UPI00221EDAE8|nr:FAD dependent oxidoreductase [Durotheca rogersii]KAI5867281.1 FAD dependent oxidoreductase [Durotheca rogersii]